MQILVVVVIVIVIADIFLWHIRKREEIIIFKSLILFKSNSVCFYFFGRLFVQAHENQIESNNLKR